MNCLGKIASNICVPVRLQVRVTVLFFISIILSTSSFGQTTIALTPPGTITAVCEGNSVSLTATSNNPLALFAVAIVSINGQAYINVGTASATTVDGLNRTFTFNSQNFVVGDASTSFEYKVRFGSTFNIAQFGLTGNFETANSQIITVNPLPTATLTPLAGVSSVCQNSSSPTVNITGVIGTAPFTFTYRVTDPLGNVSANQTIQSTGSLAQLTVPTGTVGTYTYELLQVQDASSTTCSNASTETLTMTIAPLPTATINSSSLTACQSSTAPTVTVTATGATAPYTVTYEVLTNGVSGGNQTIVTNGSGVATITPSITTAATLTYQLISVQSSVTNCVNAQNSSVTITVNPKPAFVSVAPSIPIICAGDAFFNVTLTYSGNPNQYKIDWNSAAETAGFADVPYSNFVSGSTITVTVPISATPGNYTGTLQTINTTTGCESDVSFPASFIVNPLPTATISSSTLSVCLNETTLPTVTITATGATAPYTVTYNITTNGVTVSNLTTVTNLSGTATLTVPTSTAGTIVYQLVSVQSSTTNCVNAQNASVTVTINSLPTPGINVIGSLTFCTGNSVDLQGIGGTSYSWSNGANTQITNITVGGQYSVTVRDGNGCQSITSTVVTVYSLPTVNAITGVNPVCVGSTINLTNTTPSGVWSVNNANAAINSGGVLTGQIAGTVNVNYTVTDGNNCTNLATTTVTINGLPTVNSITGANQVCVNSIINLTSTTPSGVWSVNNANANITGGGILTGLVAGTVNVSYTVTDGNNCTNLTSTTVTVNGLPTVNPIVGNTDVCIGSTISLTNTTPGGVWSVSNINAAINGTGILTGQSLGTVTVSYSVTDVNNCTATVTSVKTINALPVVAAITGSNAVCIGSAINLANATSGGVWSVNNANATINGTGVLTGQAAGTTTVSYVVTDANNCTTTVTSIKTINAHPVVAAITGSNAVCIGSTINLSNATGGGVWSVNNTNAAITGTGVLTGQAAGATTVSYAVTDGNGCTATVTSTKTINSLPIVAAITGSNAVCIGSTINLSNATAGGVWSVNNANASINGTGALTGQSAGITTVSYAVTDGNNCTTTVTSAKTINTLPVVAVITGSNTVCIGSAISLSNATGGGVWSVNNTNASINGAGILTGQSAGTTTVSYAVTDGNGCTAAVTSVKTINALPVVAAITGVNNVCIGSTINLTNATNGGVWSVNNANAVINGIGVLTGQSSGTTTVSYAVTDGNNCTTTVTAVKTINSLPIANIVPSGPLTFCSGNSVNLSATGGTSYVWNNGSTSANISNIISSGTYSVTVTDANNCVATSAPVTITVNALPTVNITNPAAVCAPGTVDLTAASIKNGSTAGLTYSYWSNAAGTQTLSTPFAIGTAGTYYIRGTNTVTNCAAIQPVVVSINPQPSIQINTPAAVCAPGTVDITAAAITSGSAAGLSYTYFSDASATTILSDANAVNTSGIYYIKGTPVSGCSAIVPVTITINPLPTLVINNPAAVCSPQTINLTDATITAGSSAGLSFNYFSNAALTTPIANAQALNASGTFYIRATDAITGCFRSGAVIVQVNAAPQGVLQTPATNIICENGSLLLNATGGNSYQWLLNQQPITGANSATYTATAAGNYAVRFISAQGCSSTSSNTINLQLLNKPTVQFTLTNACAGVSTSFNNTSVTSASGGINWLWDFGDGSSSNQFAPTHIYTSSGTYTVRLTATSPVCTGFNETSVVTYRVQSALPAIRYKDIDVLKDIPATITARAIGTSYLWLPATGVNNNRIAAPSIRVSTTTEYTVAITNDIGCTTVDTVLLKVIPGVDIYVPQGFTPNNDGQNDRLYPILVGMRQLNYFRVFNRWGSMIFTTKESSAQSGWDGLYLGVKQPMGTYTWMAEAVDLQGNVVRKTGTVLLLQ